MTLNRYAKKRDANEPDVIKALQAIGCTVQQLDRPVDLAVLFRGIVKFIEVKNPEGRNKEEESQIEFFKIWPGGFARTPEEAIELVTKSYGGT